MEDAFIDLNELSTLSLSLIDASLELVEGLLVLGMKVVANRATPGSADLDLFELDFLSLKLLFQLED